MAKSLLALAAAAVLVLVGGGDAPPGGDNITEDNIKADQAKRAAARAKLDEDLQNLQVQLDEDDHKFATQLQELPLDNRLARTAFPFRYIFRFDLAEPIKRIKVRGDDGGAIEKLAGDAPWAASLVESAASKARKFHQLLKKYDDLLDRNYNSHGKRIAHDDDDRGIPDFTTTLEDLEDLRADRLELSVEKQQFAAANKHNRQPVDKFVLSARRNEELAKYFLLPMVE